jgi:hypothetical protein
MNPPSVDIKDILLTKGLGLTFATNLFIGRELESPDDLVTIFDTPGGAPQLTMNFGERYNYPSIQIRVRNNNYLTGWNLINDIKDALHGLGPFDQGGSTYTLVKCTIEPAILDWDEADRVRFVTTFMMQRY